MSEAVIIDGGLSSNAISMEDPVSESKSEHPQDSEQAHSATKPDEAEVKFSQASSANPQDLGMLQPPKEGGTDSKDDDPNGKPNTPPPDLGPEAAKTEPREGESGGLIPPADAADDGQNHTEASRSEARYRVRSNYRFSKCGQLKKGHSCPEDLLGSHASMRPRAEQHAESTRSLLLARLKARCDDDPVRGPYGAFRRGGYTWRHDPNHRPMDRIPARWAPHPYMHSQNLFAATAYHRQKGYGGEMLEYSGGDMVRAYPSMVAPVQMPFKRGIDPMAPPDANWAQRAQEGGTDLNVEGSDDVDVDDRAPAARKDDTQPLPLLSHQDAQPQTQEAHEMMRRVTPHGADRPEYEHVHAEQVSLDVQGHKAWPAADATQPNSQNDARSDVVAQNGQHLQAEFDPRKADDTEPQGGTYGAAPTAPQPDSFGAYPESTPVSDAMTGWHERVSW